MRLSDVCAAAAPSLGALGVLGGSLLDLNDHLASVAGDRDAAAALSDPALPLTLLRSHDPAPEPSAIGGLLDFLRDLAGMTPLAAGRPAARGGGITVRAAMEEYALSRLTSYASGDTRRAYGRWATRVTEEFGDHPVAALTTGQLSCFMEERLPKPDDPLGPGGGQGASARYIGVAALRSIWTWLDDVGYAERSVAGKLAKPLPPPSARRPFTWLEQAFIRHAAASSPDPMLSLLVVLMNQRAVTRRCEVESMPISGVDFTESVLRFRGKQGRWHVRPMTPGLRAFLTDYIEDRRPAHIDPVTWARSSEPLLREKPSEEYPNGRGLGRTGYVAVQNRLRRLGPDVFVDGETCMHCLRNTAALYVRKRWGESVAKAALGHQTNDASTRYFRTMVEELREYLTDYETWTNTPPPPQPPFVVKTASDSGAVVLAAHVPSLHGSPVPATS